MVYRKVTDFFYKNKTYTMYLDKNNKHFFLRKEDDQYFYLTIEELIELTLKFNSIPNVMRIEKQNNDKKVNIIPKIVIGGTLTTISLPVLLTCFSYFQSLKRVESFDFNNKQTNIESSSLDDVKDYVSYNIDDLKDDESLEVDTFFENTNKTKLNIYDMDYADMYFDYDNVDVEDLRDVLNGNDQISPKCKDVLNEYINAIEEKYPDIDLRIFYKNLKTLEVVECTKNELAMKSLSFDSYGCYMKNENKIYVLADYDYVPGTWEYQVLFHEFTHCLRNGWWTEGDKKIKFQPEGVNYSNLITSESLNSLFAVSLFDYEEKDIAYQLQSNYHKIMIESMDNYDYSDYIQHSISYYAKKLDEFNGDDNYATSILELIQVQYDSYHDDSIQVEQSSFYPIYDYIANMYYKTNITSNMSYSEANDVKEELIDKIMYDVPSGYNIDTKYFDNTLNNYCNKVGISVSSKTR